MEKPTTTPEVSVVLPTMNRGPALRQSLGPIRAMEGVGEILVVEGGGAKETAEVIEAQEDPRIRLLLQPADRPGLSAARNIGLEQASLTWALNGEDDCWFPPDYASILREEAAAHDAHVAGAPWLPVPPDDPEQAMARARARPVEQVVLDGQTGFPPRTIVTPFLPAPSLVHREVFDRIRFDERYLGNAYREETAFYVEVARAGFTTVLTPRTAIFQLGQWEGGARRPRLSYEYWTYRNNWYFLGRHGAWLADQGYIGQRTRVGAQLAFVAERTTKLAGGFVGARIDRARGRVGARRAARGAPRVR